MISHLIAILISELGLEVGSRDVVVAVVAAVAVASGLVG